MGVARPYGSWREDGQGVPVAGIWFLRESRMAGLPGNSLQPDPLPLRPAPYFRAETPGAPPDPDCIQWQAVCGFFHKAALSSGKGGYAGAYI